MRAEAGADERRLAVVALQVLGLLAVPVAGGAGLVAGPAGIGGAVAGLALVAVLFAGAAALLATVVDREPTTALAVLVMGLGVRLLAYVAVLAALDAHGWVHRPSLAAATGLGIAVTLLTATEYGSTLVPAWLGVLGLLPSLVGLVATVSLWRDRRA